MHVKFLVLVFFFPFLAFADFDHSSQETIQREFAPSENHAWRKLAFKNLARFIDKNGYHIGTPDQYGPVCWAHSISNAIIEALMVPLPEPPVKPLPIIPGPLIPGTPPQQIAATPPTQPWDNPVVTSFRIPENEMMTEAEEPARKPSTLLSMKEIEKDATKPASNRPSKKIMASLRRKYNARKIARFQPNWGNSAEGSLSLARRVGWGKQVSMKIVQGYNLIHKILVGMKKGIRYAGYFGFMSHAMAIIGVDEARGFVICRDSNLRGQIVKVPVSHRGGWEVIGVVNKKLKDGMKQLRRQ